MDLKQMEYFKTVVDTGSINQAAKILHMSQPPLSMSMKKLEEELKASLFIRGNKRITLTEAGTLFYQRITRILELTDSTLSDVAKAASNKTFTLGLTPSTIPVVSETLAKFSDDHPEVRFQIYDGSTFELQHLLDSNIIDAAFVRTPFASGELKTIEFDKEPMVCAIPETLKPENVKSNDKTVSLKALSLIPLSIYRRYQDLITDAFASIGIEPYYFGICDDARTSMLWAKNGKAVAVFPKSLGIDQQNGLTILPIKEKALETSILFVYRESAINKIPVLKMFIPFVTRASNSSRF